MPIIIVVRLAIKAKLNPEMSKSNFVMFIAVGLMLKDVTY